MHLAVQNPSASILFSHKRLTFLLHLELMFNLTGNKAQNAEVLHGLRHGEGPPYENAVSHLYGKCRAGVSAWLKRHGALREEVEDVFQEALLALLRKIQKDPAFDVAPDAYLFGAACHIWQKICRNKGREIKVKSGWAYANSLEYEDETALEKSRESEETLNELLAELSESCRTLLNDFYVEKLDLTEIARKHGFKTMEVAKQSKYRCMERLKALAREKRKGLNT